MANYFFNVVEVPVYYFNTVEGPQSYFFNTEESPVYYFNTVEGPQAYFFNTLNSPVYFFNTQPGPTKYFFNTIDRLKYFYNTELTPTRYFFNIEEAYTDIVERAPLPAQTISSIDEKKILAKDIVIERINELLASANKKERVGVKATCEYFDINAILFVIDFLSSIRFKMDEDQKYGIIREDNFYYILYKIETLEKKYRCLKINIKELVSIFGIREYEPEIYVYPDVVETEGGGLFSDTFAQVFD